MAAAWVNCGVWLKAVSLIPYQPWKPGHSYVTLPTEKGIRRRKSRIERHRRTPELTHIRGTRCVVDVCEVTGDGVLQMRHGCGVLTANGLVGSRIGVCVYPEMY